VTAETNNEDNRAVANPPPHAAKGFSIKLRIEIILAIVSKGKPMRNEIFFGQRKSECRLPILAESATKMRNRFPFKSPLESSIKLRATCRIHIPLGTGAMPAISTRLVDRSIAGPIPGSLGIRLIVDRETRCPSFDNYPTIRV